MLFLIDDKFNIYCSEYYGCETWGTAYQKTLIKKRKHWYIHIWRYMYHSEYDGEDEYIKINVIAECIGFDELRNTINGIIDNYNNICKKVEELRNKL